MLPNWKKSRIMLTKREPGRVREEIKQYEGRIRKGVLANWKARESLGKEDLAEKGGRESVSEERVLDNEGEYGRGGNIN